MSGKTVSGKAVSGKELVREFVEQGFGAPDPDVFRRLVAEDYVQHNPQLPSGLDGLLGFVAVVASIPDNAFTIQVMLEDGPLVATHAEWRGGGQHQAVIDLYRLEDGLFREHWDVMQPIDPDAARPVVGPPREPTDHAATEENKRRLVSLAERCLVGGDLELLGRSCAPRLFQHDAGVEDGAEAFLAHLAEGARRHTRVHRVVGEGDLVLLQAEGEHLGEPAALYHLFRFEDGLIHEHWSVTQQIPSEMPHDNGMF